MVEIKVDMINREKLRRLHTATHILNYSLRKVLGSHVWQNGSNLKVEIGSLDITHYENLTFEEIAKVEKIANQIIFENRKVYVEELDRADAEKKYGFGLYQGGAIPMKTLRVVKIEDSDIEACGGIHMQETGGIGIMKIVDTQKIQDGVVRVRFVVNEFALDLISEKQKVLKDVAEVFSVSEGDVLRTSEKFFSEWKERGKVIDKLKDEIKSVYLKSILGVDGVEFVLDGDYDMAFMMDLFGSVLKEKKEFKLVSSKFVLATSNFSVDVFKKVIDKGSFKIYII